MRTVIPDQASGPWVWVLPISYVIHLLEEGLAGGGFPAWIARMTGSGLPVTRWLLINAVCMAVLVTGLGLARRSAQFGWFPVSAATVVIINGLAHAIASAVNRSYSPGLVSGILCWLPLGAFFLARGWVKGGRLRFWTAVAAGICFHVVLGAAALLATAA